MLIVVFYCTPQACINWHKKAYSIFRYTQNFQKKVSEMITIKSRSVNTFYCNGLSFVIPYNFADKKQNIDVCMAVESKV